MFTAATQCCQSHKRQESNLLIPRRRSGSKDNENKKVAARQEQHEAIGFTKRMKKHHDKKPKKDRVSCNSIERSMRRIGSLITQSDHNPICMVSTRECTMSNGLMAIAIAIRMRWKKKKGVFCFKGNLNSIRFGSHAWASGSIHEGPQLHQSATEDPRSPPKTLESAAPIEVARLAALDLDSLRAMPSTSIEFCWIGLNEVTKTSHKTTCCQCCWRWQHWI